MFPVFNSLDAFQFHFFFLLSESVLEVAIFAYKKVIGQWWVCAFCFSYILLLVSVSN